MMRRTYRLVDRKLVEVTRDAPAVRLHVIGDEIAKPFSGFGKMQTSKSGWRREVRARGYEEVGNERQEFNPPQHKYIDMRQDIARLMDG